MANFLACTNPITNYIWIILNDLFAQIDKHKPVCINDMNV